MTDDETELPGESELYDLFLETQTKAVALAEQLGLSNEDLKNIETRWTKISAKNESDGHAMVSLAHYVLTIRRIQQLSAMMKPGETLVPLVELADRFDKSGDHNA